MGEPAPPVAHDSKAPAAMWIRAGDFGVGGQPVVAVGFPLASRKKRQDRRKRVHGDHLSAIEHQVLPDHSEIFALHMATDRRAPVEHSLHPQVVEPKSTFAVAIHAPDLHLFDDPTATGPSMA